MIPLLCKEVFGRKAYAKIFGYLLGISSFGMAIGTTAINWVYDFTHSYLPSLIALIFLCTVTTIIGVIGILIAKKGRSEPEWCPPVKE